MSLENDFTATMASFGPFEERPTLAVAISGGPDSMALLLLAADWCHQQEGKVIALTVDHRLRETSTEEALQVNQWVEERGIEHHILTWHHKDIITGIQKKAREERYRLMADFCLQQGILHLLTAHHSQDQLETFFQRLAQGSGLKGLQGILPQKYMLFGRLLRPLLKIPPQNLKDFLQEKKCPFLEDPSNTNPRFSRVRWRQLLPVLEKEGVTPQKLCFTLDFLHKDTHILEEILTEALARTTTFDSFGLAHVSITKLEHYSIDLIIHIFRHILKAISGEDYPPKFEAVYRLVRRLNISDTENKGPTTLQGCYIHKKKKEFLIGREYKVLKNKISIFNHEGIAVWDNRFKLTCSDSLLISKGQVRALGVEGIQILQKEDIIPSSIPSPFLKTLPGIWINNKLIACPSLGWNLSKDIQISISIMPKRRLTEN
jgi:tRNA(Ile)-lysidine synthase